jgi:hypothetical protein
MATPVSQQGSDSGAFVVRLGTDTISIERYTRRGNRIEAVVAGRTPRTAVARLVFTLAPDGSVATAAVGRGTQPMEERAPPVPGTIPLAGGFWVPWELALHQAHANRNSTVINLLAGGFAGGIAAHRSWPLLPSTNLGASRGPDGRAANRSKSAAAAQSGVAWPMSKDGRTAARDSGITRPTSATVQGAAVSVSYGRPSLRGRRLDVLVPPGQVWRAGSNDATTITTDRPLAFQGYTLAPGTYSMFIQADPGRWTLILNRQTGRRSQRDPAQDLARIPMEPTSRPDGVHHQR